MPSGATDLGGCERFTGARAEPHAGGLPDPARVESGAARVPVQLKTAIRCGLDIPRTIVTNDKMAAIEFADAVGGPVVCKMLSSLVLSEHVTPCLTYTSRVDPYAIDPESFAITAHLVQEWARPTSRV